MSSTILLGTSAAGGILATFLASGWSAYNQKKIPELPILFRWFIAGLMVVGLTMYAWMFGANGDPAVLVETVKESLSGSFGETVKDLGATASSVLADGVAELHVGMPNF